MPVIMKRPGKRQTQEIQASTSKKGKPSASKEGEPSHSKRESVGRGSGILRDISGKYTSFIVNIRPSKWKKNLVWIGQLKTYEDAQQVADLVFHYIGKGPFHFKDVVREYPSITCMDTVLSTLEECAKYVSSIAKDEFEPQRIDFSVQVKKVLRRPEFAFLPADHGVVSPKGDDVEPAVVLPKGDEVEDDEEEGIPPMEDDEIAERARKMISNGGPAAVRPGSVSFAVDSNNFSGVHTVHANIAGFEVQPSESGSNLRSMVQPIDSINLPKSPDRSTSQDGDIPGFEVQPSESVSELQRLLESIDSIILPESPDRPTSQNVESGPELKQLMDELTGHIGL